MAGGFIARWVTSRIRFGLEVMPVVVLAGVRQTGKTTLLRHEFSDWVYYDLDDPSVLALVKDQPRTLLSQNRVIVDEAQRLPELFNVLRAVVDEKRPSVILSGSVNFLMMQRISQSLVGRAGYVTLYPFTWAESQGRPRPSFLEQALSRGEVAFQGSSLPAPDSRFPLWRGWLPPLLHLETKGERAISFWWDSYVRTYLERDMRDLSQISSLADFHQVMVRVALNTGSPLNETRLAADVGVSQPTVHRWINLLETSGIVMRVPGYAPSQRKRLTKRAKVYFVDSGLTAHLMGLASPPEVGAEQWGLLLENYVAVALRAHADLMEPTARLYHWRMSGGKEVDFVLEWQRRLLPIEVKAREEVDYRRLRGLRAFLDVHKDRSTLGLVIYLGNELHMLGPSIALVPWWWL